VTVHTKVKVDSVEPASNGASGVVAKLSDGKTISAAQVLVSVGRAFNVDGLGLENVGIKQNRNGSITVDKTMRTNVKNIFAIGDVAGVVLLAYTATAEGHVAVDNILGKKKKINYDAVPSVIFTHPEIGSVGLTEAQAKEQYGELIIGRYPMRALGKAHAEGETAGEAKVIGDAKTDKLLGVHVIGAHAPDVVHTAALAIHQGLTVTELGGLIFAHPVMSEAVMEAAHDAHGLSVHLGAKKKAPSASKTTSKASSKPAKPSKKKKKKK